jgi:hypothetical protein
MRERATHETCTCAEPVPMETAGRKGAARTICGRCGRPVAPRLDRPKPRAA